jgi:hypothetical protein
VEALPGPSAGVADGLRPVLYGWRLDRQDIRDAATRLFSDVDGAASCLGADSSLPGPSSNRLASLGVDLQAGRGRVRPLPYCVARRACAEAASAELCHLD